MQEDRVVLALACLFVVTLGTVYVLESAVLWVFWGATMMALSGGLLVRSNRET
ncbi:hypothetical protein ACFQO4_14235 [Saliphagus sp. GCM10025334]